MEDAEFDRLLKICRLKLSEEEKVAIKKDIDSIIEYFNTIENIDCNSYSPAYQPIDIPPKERADNIEEFKEVGKLLKNSKIYRFYIVGPKI